MFVFVNGREIRPLHHHHQRATVGTKTSERGQKKIADGEEKEKEKEKEKKFQKSASGNIQTV